MRDGTRKLQRRQVDLRKKYDELKERLGGLPSPLPPTPSLPSPSDDAALVRLLVSAGLTEEEARAHVESVRAGMDAIPVAFV